MRLFYLSLSLLLFAKVSFGADQFSVSYLETKNQLYAYAPNAGQDQKTYRLCVIFLNASAQPEKGIVADQAAYAEHGWTLKGWEIKFDAETLLATSEKRISGPYSELIFNPTEPLSDPRVRKFGAAFVFSPDSGPDFHSNVSMFATDPKTAGINYFFARHVEFATDGGKKSLIMQHVLGLMNNAKGAAPAAMTCERTAIPIPDKPASP